MVVISSLCILALCLLHTQLCAWLSFPKDLEPLVGNQGANTNTNSSEYQTLFHNWNDKESSRLKNTNTGKLGISGARWNESPESLNFADRLSPLNPASGGKEHSSMGHPLQWRTVTVSPCSCDRVHMADSSGKPPRAEAVTERGSVGKHLQQPLRGCWEAASGTCSHTPSSTHPLRQMQLSRKETSFSECFM